MDRDGTNMEPLRFTTFKTTENKVLILQETVDPRQSTVLSHFLFIFFPPIYLVDCANRGYLSAGPSCKTRSFHIKKPYTFSTNFKLVGELPIFYHVWLTINIDIWFMIVCCLIRRVVCYILYRDITWLYYMSCYSHYKMGGCLFSKFDLSTRKWGTFPCDRQHFIFFTVKDWANRLEDKQNPSKTKNVMSA